MLKINPSGDRRSWGILYSCAGSASAFGSNRSLWSVTDLRKTHRTRFPQGPWTHRTRPQRSTGVLALLLDDENKDREDGARPITRGGSREPLPSSLCSDECSACPESAFTMAGTGVHLGRNAQLPRSTPAPSASARPTSARLASLYGEPFRHASTQEYGHHVGCPPPR